MTLRLLKPSLGYQRSGLRLLEHQAPEQVVDRLRGEGLRLMRKRLLARCGALCECEQCQAGYPMKLTWATFEADHILPLHLGGTNSISNFRALHVDCHARVTAEQRSIRAAMGERPERERP